MNRILFEAGFDRTTLPASDPRLEHIRGVLRAKPGDVLDIGIINGATGKGTVLASGPEGLVLAAQWNAPPPALPEVSLLVGMPRPQTARKILFEATTLGVDRLVFFNADRSDPAYGKSRLWTTEEWRTHLVRGAEQAFDTHLPEIVHEAALDTAIGCIDDERCRLALDVYEGTASLGARIPEGGAALAIGPERGWTSRERTLFRSNGFELVHLGPRVLRVETSAVAALALLHSRRWA